MVLLAWAWQFGGKKMIKKKNKLALRTLIISSFIGCLSLKSYAQEDGNNIEIINSENLTDEEDSDSTATKENPSENTEPEEEPESKQLEKKALEKNTAKKADKKSKKKKKEAVLAPKSIFPRMLVIESVKGNWQPLKFSSAKAPTPLHDVNILKTLNFDDARLCLDINRFQKKPGSFEVSTLFMDVYACSVDFILGIHPQGGSFLFSRDSWPQGQLVTYAKAPSDIATKFYQLDRLLYETHGIGAVIVKVEGKRVDVVGLSDFFVQTKVYSLIQTNPGPIEDSQAKITRLGYRDQNAKFEIEAEQLKPGYLLGTAERDSTNHPKNLIYRDLDQFIKKKAKPKF